MSMSSTKVYRTWKVMKARCTNPNHKAYRLYKGKLCDEWYDSRVFVEWALSNGYKEGLTIDRVNPNLGYSPDNCQFITAKENTIKGNKERRLRTYLYNGKEYIAKELADLLGVCAATITARTKKGIYQRLK